MWRGNANSIEKIKSENKDVIIYYKNNLNEGLIGIIAARLKDYFNKPSIVITNSNNLLKASARSTTKYNIGHIIKYLIEKKTMIDGKKVPVFPGAFVIYGNGNVACLGQAMEEFQSDLPGYRGHHEQSMALTGIGYARAMRRKQIFIAHPL